MSSLTGQLGGCPRSVAGEHTACCVYCSTDVCLCKCRCDLLGSNQRAVILPKLQMSGSLCVCVCVRVCVCVCVYSGWSNTQDGPSRIPQGWKQEADIQRQQPIPMRILIWLLQSDRCLTPVPTYQRGEKDRVTVFLLKTYHLTSDVASPFLIWFWEVFYSRWFGNPNKQETCITAAYKQHFVRLSSGSSL